MSDVSREFVFGFAVMGVSEVRKGEKEGRFTAAVRAENSAKTVLAKLQKRRICGIILHGKRVFSEVIKMKKPYAIIIMDGYGINPDKNGNAIELEGSPNVKRYEREYPSSQLGASGMSVGLPEGQMGN